MQLQKKERRKDGLHTKVYRRFHHAVIYDQRYLVYLDGLKVTILISIFAILIGVAIGLFIAVVKVTVSKNICQNFEVVL